MIITKLKAVAEKIPYPIGRLSSRIPYSWRLGSTYSEYSRLIPIVENANAEHRNAYIIKMLDSIVRHAQQHIPFYQSLYGKDPLKIESLSDFDKLPVISRNQVREYAKESSGAYFLNTGGSTGGPLYFYVDRNAWAREWAHMHYVWRRRHYKPTDLMVTMLGKPLSSGLSKYNAVHNELLLDPYSPIERGAAEFIKLVRAYPIRFFQGYPSNIYNVFKAAEQYIKTELRKEFAKNIKGLLFSSEYPSEYMVQYLREEWGLFNYMSWYGHSEMCVLAYDLKSNYNYKPLFTYGYAEEQNGMLIGTSFHNYDMPLIRYQTEDIISAIKDNSGVISSFQITGGRVSDFIEDKKGQQHSLTFFLGRHHTIYNHADFIQIYQGIPGFATYYIVPSHDFRPSSDDLSFYFDIPQNLDIVFDYCLIKKPIRTKSGKFKLKLTKDDIYTLEDEAGRAFLKRD